MVVHTEVHIFMILSLATVSWGGGEDGEKAEASDNAMTILFIRLFLSVFFPQEG